MGFNFGWVLTMVVVVGFDCCEELVFVAEFWWKVGCMGLLERETKRKREEREIEEKRETKFFKFEVYIFLSLKFPNKSPPRTIGMIVTSQV